MRFSVDLPKRFENTTDDEEEVHGKNADRPVFQKSILGVLSQAGARPKLEETSESEPEVEEEHGGQGGHAAAQAQGEGRWKRQFDDTKSSLSLRKPGPKRTVSQSHDAMSQSQFLPPRETTQDLPERPASADLRIRDETELIERKLQAQANAQLEASTSSIRQKSKDKQSASKKVPTLVNAVAEIFDFDEPEDVAAVWSCWYMEKMLLQGHIYVTSEHVCFYAYLRKKGAMIKSGFMAKKGKRDPRYSRYWFTLKGDVLSYYKDASHLYFPHGSIDLRFAITAALAPEKGKSSKETAYFTITTETRTYYLKADSATNASEWVKQLQRVIFRNHNDGDSVKISLPIQSIFDVEAAPFVDGAETIKVCSMDSEDAAIDEHFFTFPSRGNDAFHVLNKLVEDNQVNAAARSDEDATAFSGDTRSPSAGKTSSKGSQKSSLFQPPGPVSKTSIGGKGEKPSMSSHGTSQRRRLSKSPRSPSMQESSDSLTTSIDQVPTSPSNGPSDFDLSASQLLAEDQAFRAPTLRMPAPKRSDSESSHERLRNDLHEASRSPSISSGHASVKPSRRAHIDQPLGDRESLHSRKSVDTVAPRGKTESKSQGDSNSTIAPRPSRPLAMPLHTASKMASYVRDQSKRGLSYLSSSPGIYYEKVSGALSGGRRHYIGSEGLPPDDSVRDDQEAEIQEQTRRFRSHFSLPESEQLVSSHGASMYRIFPLWGKIYLGTRYFCYRSLIAGISSKLVIPLHDLHTIQKQKGYRVGCHAMVVIIKGHEELFFEFPSADDRDICAVGILRGIEAIDGLEESALLTEKEAVAAEASAAENELLQQALDSGKTGPEFGLKDVEDDGQPILFDDGNASMLDFKPKESMRITCLTIGSRGDVQPYIALCKGLIADGHRPKIATHAEFEPWIRKHGIDFAPVGGNPAELMALCVEYGMFTPKFISETNSKFRGWLDDLLVSAWKACEGSEVLIESPSAMAGIHIAEALGIPYFRAFTMPWTKTRAYPHAFAPLAMKFGGNYNISTYTVFNNVFWQLTARQINSWRRRTLGIRSTSITAMRQNEVPFLYNFSPNVVAPPLDFSAWVHVTGYWFLDEAKDWTPPADLLAFIEKARDDGMKLVYIGFGSVVVSDSKAMTQNIVDAVLKADVRCILSKGWSDRLDAKEPNKPEIPLPPSIFQIASAPHDWLFKQIDAAVHHGGAGTTGASLRAGIPTIIKPFFGDQFFFSTRVQDIGVGLCVNHITPNALGKALWIATHDGRIRTKARVLGERIRAENGVQTAINALYRDLEYAKRLVKRKVGMRLRTPGEKVAEYDGDDDGDADFGGSGGEEDGEEEMESWTMVDGDTEADATGQAGVGIGDPLGWAKHVAQRRFLGGYGV